jgi:uncharacterized protein YkwD
MSWLHLLPTTLMATLTFPELAPTASQASHNPGFSELLLVAQAPPLTYQGTLQEGDRILSFDGSLFDAYEFEGQRGQVINIEMHSSDFDTYLILIGPDGEWLAQNDDITSQNFNSAIALILPETGVYRILANAYNSRGRGNYTLTISPVGTPPVASPSPASPASSPPQASPAMSSNAPTDMAQELLAAHNRYRQEVGIAPLSWSERLANSAQQWANHLASSNSFEHSQGDYGENLWMGSAGRYSYAQMVQAWGNEQQYFIPDRAFPNVSTTGNWADVGHYTQIVWEDTTEVGCATATGNGWDYLVCQYSPPGNYQGQQPY